MAVIAWGIRHANDRMANSGAPNPVPDPSLNGRYRGFRLGDTAALGAQPWGASMARSIDNISDRDSAPSRRRIRATWCSTVLAEMNSWLPMSRYGIPSSNISATSRSRLGNLVEVGGIWPTRTTISTVVADSIAGEASTSLACFLTHAR